MLKSPRKALTEVAKMSKVYERTENGTTTAVSLREGLDEINHAMMDGKRDVREMSAGRTDARIEYKDGRSVRLVQVDAPEDEQPAAPSLSVHVVSVRGGKVHTAMPGLDDEEADVYPLCRGGGMNQMLTKFRVVDAPLTCKTCQTYAERRAARTGA